MCVLVCVAMLCVVCLVLSSHQNKMQEMRGDGMSFGDVGVGYACRKGLKPESPNQDDFFIYRSVGCVSHRQTDRQTDS